MGGSGSGRGGRFVSIVGTQSYVLSVKPFNRAHLPRGIRGKAEYPFEDGFSVDGIHGPARHVAPKMKTARREAGCQRPGCMLARALQRPLRTLTRRRYTSDRRIVHACTSIQLQTA